MADRQDIVFAAETGKAVAVFGFRGASSTLLSGRSLHYQVHLEDCTRIDKSKEDPEFVETFGGHVTIWRTFNDKEIAELPFMVFYGQKMLFDRKGQMAHIVRDIEIWANNSAIVRSVVYNTDYSLVISVESYRCFLTNENQTGNIDFQAQSQEPTRLLSYRDMISALGAGKPVHFNAMAFLCAGGREHTFQTFGGQITNYELITTDIDEKYMCSSVQQTVYYDVTSDIHVLDVINLNIYDNRTAEIIDTRGRPLYHDLTHVHRSFCTLNIGMPGGTFSIFTKEN